MALSYVRARKRARALVTTALLSSSAVILAGTSAFAQPADAKTALADADKAVKSKDWATAAKSFDAANKAFPSSDALDGLANALYQGGQLGEAHAAYTEWLDKFGAKAPAAKKKTAETRLKELADKTGGVTIAANEAGAQILIDDKPVGTTPLAAPVRLTAGPHRIRITKDGFIPFDQAPNVGAGSTTAIQATLNPASNKGKLVVKEKTGQGVRVLVDGVDVGPAPWTGEVDVGPHEVGARGTGLVATSQKVAVERGKTQEIELVASSQSASVKIGTSDGKGLIYVDGRLVGEGSFIGEVPAGTHKLKITREGYDPFEEDLVVKDKEPLARTVTLKLSSTITTGEAQEEERVEGIYGGFGIAPLFMPGGTGSVMETQCDSKKPPLLSCETPSGFGGGLGGFVGYHWNPVGIELYVAGSYDQRTHENDWDSASGEPGLGADPARREEFNLRRAGFMGLARVRLNAQSKRIRFSFAVGAGISYRVLSLERLVTSKENPQLRDVFVPDSANYVAPVIQVEPSIMYRLSPNVALSLGVQAFFETPSSFLNGNKNPTTERSATHALGLQGLTTPAYELASNVQFFIGPTVGMMFGP